jgi:hypothetical protein
MNSALAELVDMGRDDLAFDARREKREIKEAGLALEARRDANKKGLLDKKEDSSGSPTLNKKKGGGMLDSIMKIAGPWLKNLLLPVVSGLAGLVGLKKILGFADNADDISKVANKVDDLSKTASKLSTKVDDVARATTYADDIAKVGNKVDDVVKNGVKATNLIKQVDNIDEIARGADAATDILKNGTKATNMIKQVDNIDEIARGADAAADVLKNGTKATNMIKQVDNLDAITGLGTKMDEGFKAVNVGVKGVQTTMAAKNVATGVDAGVDAAKLVKHADDLPINSVVINKLDEAVKAGAVVTDAAADTAKAAQQAKTIATGAKTGGKLLSRISKVLAPLDIVNKMGQGQSFFESLGNMTLELGQLAVGGVDWLSEKATGGEGILAAKSTDYMIRDGDLLGNKDKWQTSYLEQGINKGVAAWTGTEQVANKKTWTEEQEKLTEEAEKAGAVEVGFGMGKIEDLEKLSLLDPKSLQALLDFEVWSDKDMKMLEDIRDAKIAGKSVTYDDGGWLGRERVDIGPGDGLDAHSPTVQGVDVSGSGVETPLDGDKRLTRKESIDAISREMQDATSLEEYEGLQKQLYKVKGMTSDEFDDLTPDAGIMDRFYEAGTTKGSIYVHDINVERAVNDALEIKLGKVEAIESDWLDKLKVTAGEWAEKASQNSGQAPSMVNAPTTIDQSSKQSVNVGSSAHAPAQPLGSGYMGVSTPRG